LGHAALAQYCLSITSPNNTASISFSSPWWGNWNAGPAYFSDNLTSDTAGIPAGTYLGWCADVIDDLNVGTTPISFPYTTLYSTSACDTGLDTALGNIAANYQTSLQTVTPTTWNQINWLLNYKNNPNNTIQYWYDIQLAIWTLLGQYNSLPSLAFAGLPYYAPYNLIEVGNLVSAATTGGKTWQPTCGGVIAVVVSINNNNPNDSVVNPYSATAPEQLTIFEYPVSWASVSGNVVRDCNGHTPVPGTDTPLTGWTVSLLSSAQKPLASTQTDKNGYYSFPNIVPGSYIVQVTPPPLPANYIETYPTAGGSSSAGPLTLNACQPLVQNFGYADDTLSVTCPPNTTIPINYCPVFCTFTCSDWCSPCNDRNGNPTWWINWDQQNHSYGNYNCMNTWSDWYTYWTGNNPGGNLWNFCQNQQSGNNSQNNWWGGSCNPNSAPSWCASYNYGNPNNTWWLPCNGNNPGNVLNNCFSTIYSCGYVQVGSPSGNCVKLTSCNAVRQCLGFSGNAGCLNSSAINPSSCSAGSFCAQVLALQLNCDFGDAGASTGLGGACGDLVYNDSTSPCNGQKVRDILKTANCVLGGGSAPSGCTASYLCGLCGNLNQCFEGCQVTSWCKSHLVPVYIPPTCVSGKATATAGACLSTPVLTYCDTVASGACPGDFVITRTWTATSGGTSASCNQTITITPSPGPSISGTVVNAGSQGGWNNWNNFSGDPGLQGVTVTLTDSKGVGVGKPTTTDANGNFTFPNPLPPGSTSSATYIVVVTPPKGDVQAYPTTGTANQISVTITGGCNSVCNLLFAYYTSSNNSW
jgi:hypothetical protein